MIFLKREEGRNYCSLIKILISLALLLVAGCKEKLPSVPSDVIQPPRMVSILIDMHITDAVAETRAFGTAKTEMLYTQQYYAQIYKNHGITKEEFLKSYLFYENNPVLLNKVYDEVLVEMSQRESSIK